MGRANFELPLSKFAKLSLVFHTAHAPSHEPSSALALMVGRTCIFSSCRPAAAGGGWADLDLALTTIVRLRRASCLKFRVGKTCHGPNRRNIVGLSWR
jgi:hypothetical protein